MRKIVVPEPQISMSTRKPTALMFLDWFVSNAMAKSTRKYARRQP
jgi:hypothetical protein